MEGLIVKLAAVSYWFNPKRGQDQHSGLVEYVYPRLEIVSLEFVHYLEAKWILNRIWCVECRAAFVEFIIELYS